MGPDQACGEGQLSPVVRSSLEPSPPSLPRLRARPQGEQEGFRAAKIPRARAPSLAPALACQPSTCLAAWGQGGRVSVATVQSAS